MECEVAKVEEYCKLMMILVPVGVQSPFIEPVASHNQLVAKPLPSEAVPAHINWRHGGVPSFGPSAAQPATPPANSRCFELAQHHFLRQDGSVRRLVHELHPNNNWGQLDGCLAQGVAE